jgi:hypothetical protein
MPGGGGRMSRAERSGDTRKFGNKKVPMGKMLLRLWRYIGKNRLLVVLALIVVVFVIQAINRKRQRDMQRKKRNRRR